MNQWAPACRQKIEFSVQHRVCQCSTRSRKQLATCQQAIQLYGPEQRTLRTHHFSRTNGESRSESTLHQSLQRVLMITASSKNQRAIPARYHRRELLIESAFRHARRVLVQFEDEYAVSKVVECCEQRVGPRLVPQAARGSRQRSPLGTNPQGSRRPRCRQQNPHSPVRRPGRRCRDRLCPC